jgi:general stress protein YciG
MAQQNQNQGGQGKQSGQGSGGQSQSGKGQSGQSQGKENNPGNFANDREKASEAGKKGGRA